MQVKTVVGHSLWEFLSEIQEAILEGYLLSDKSEYFPYSSGPLNIVHMVKEENEHSEEETPQEGEDVLPCWEGTSTVAGGVASGAAVEKALDGDVLSFLNKVEYNPNLVALADVLNIEKQSGAAIPPVEKKKPGRKAKV